MPHLPRCLGVALLLSCATVGFAQSYSFTKLAGMSPTYGTQDGPGTDARFNVPTALAVGPNGDVFVSDALNHTVRKITAAGVVSTFAGLPGVTGKDNGIGSAARFDHPAGIAVDSAGNVWVTDAGNHAIRKITPAGAVSTFAGQLGVIGANEGVGTAAQFANPAGIAVDADGNVYVCDRGNRTIRKITPAGLVSTFAGLVGTPGNSDGTGSAARFNVLAGLSIEKSSGTLYATDSGSDSIRRITKDAVVTTLAGGVGTGYVDGIGAGAKFNTPRGVAVDASGNVFVADTLNDCIRRVSSAGVTSIFAGSPGIPGTQNGSGTGARFFVPTSLTFDSSGNMYVADSQNHSIRKITPGATVTLLAGGGGNFGSADGSGETAQFYMPHGITMGADGALYVADAVNGTIRRVTLDGLVSTYAGLAGMITYSDGERSKARFGFPFGITTSATGMLWVSDTIFNTVRLVSESGVGTAAGIPGTTGGLGDGTFGVGQLYRPRGVVLDRSGNAYIADGGNHTIRKISPQGVMTTLAGNPGVYGTLDGLGRDSRFNTPVGIAIDDDGVLYVTDGGNATIRKVTPQGLVSTFVGSPGFTGSADGVGANARFLTPFGITIDRNGTLFVTDTDNQTIRKVTRDGRVTTIGGEVGVYGHSNGTGSAAHFYAPAGITCDANGVLYIVETFNNIVVRGALDSVPFISTPPLSMTVRPGTNVILSVGATGGGLNYQWEFNGTPIAGATGSTYALTNVQNSGQGSYGVTVSNSAGTTSSSKAVVTVSTGASTSRISNLAIRSQAGTGAQTLIVGFSIGGNNATGRKPLLIRGVGPTLSAFGVSGVIADPKLEIFTAAGAKFTENDDWAGDAQIVSVCKGVGAFALSGPASKDAALYNQTFALGGYTAQISGNASGTGVALAEIYDASDSSALSDTTPRLINVSARTQVGTGGDILIAGFVINGDTAKNVLIRAIGPTLDGFGVQGALADPKLELYNDRSVKIYENDNWGGSGELAGAFASVGAFRIEGTSKDAALVVTLAPGNYTAQVTGVGGTSGVALVEVYELP